MSSPALARITVRLASVLFLTAASLRGQQTVPPAATAVPLIASLPTSAADTFELILTSRALDTVRREKDRFLGERRDAETRWTAMRDSASRLTASIGEVKTAITDASKREKSARKDKRDADRSAALADKRRLERSLSILESRVDLRMAQAEQARLERDFLDAAVRADDAELTIAERREQVLPDDPTQRTAFQELTSRWLQALRTRSARAYDVADRRFRVVEAQIELLKRLRS